MDPHPAEFLPLQPYIAPEPASTAERDDLRITLRTSVDEGLRECLRPPGSVALLLMSMIGTVTGVRRARLSYSARRYAHDIVIKYGYKLSGWPKNIPFRDFNSIRGGNAVLRKLIRLWNKRVLRFERATSEDIETAKRDPRAVLPGAAKTPPPAPAPASSSGAVDVFPIIEDVGDLDHTSEHPHAAPPTTAPLDDHPARQQRIDTKKPRRRDLTGRYVCSHPLPKSGIKSKPYIIDSDAEDDFGQPAAEPGEFYFFDEPIPEFWSAATGSAFAVFASSPFASYGRPSGTMSLSGIGMASEPAMEEASLAGSVCCD